VTHQPVIARASATQLAVPSLKTQLEASGPGSRGPSEFESLQMAPLSQGLT
jgi:hypothetical protein